MGLVLDIETVGQRLHEIPERALEYLYQKVERDHPSEEERDRRRAELVEKFALDPATGRIVCIGLVDTESGSDEALIDPDESALLRSFWTRVREDNPELWVTFNGKRFDIPYIKIRSAILGIPPTLYLSEEPYTYHPHFDVYETLAGRDSRRRGGSLDFFCSIFGLSSPKDLMEGSQVGEAFHQGRIEEIAAYCLADCHATHQIFEHLKPYYL